MDELNKILIVDDEPRVLQALARNLELAGYRVFTAAGGAEALRLYQQECPDVSLLDVQMPQMDGFAVLAAIRALNADAEVIQMTSHGDMETTIKALRAGASDFLPKPVERDVLQAALHRAQERLRLKRELAQTREDLRASEADYRAITETAFVGVGVVDLQETLTFVNAAFADMLGYTREELVGMNLAQLAPPEAFDFYCQQTLRRRANVRDQYETRLVARDGRMLDVLVSVAPLRERGAQEVTHSLGVVADITERKRAEETLRQSQVLLNTAGRINRFGGWSVDLVQNRVSWSDQVAIIHEAPLGYSPSVEEGINFYAPEWRERITQVFTACAQEGVPYDEELEIITVHGNRIWVRTTGEAERDETGTIVRVVGAFQDISTYKQATEALAQERILLRTVIDNIPDAVYVKDLETRKQLANRADLENMGLKNEAEVLGLTDFDIFPHEVATRFYHNDQAVLSSGQPMLDCEERLLRADGSERWLLTSKVPLHDLQGQIMGLVGIGRDITELKQAEETLRQSHQELTTALHDLQNAQEQLVQQERLAATGQLAAGIAHDFNNVLAVIQLYTELTLQTLPLPRRVEQALKTIRQQAQRGTDLVQQMLDFARRTPLKRQVIALPQLLAEIYSLLKSTLPENIRITLTGDSEPLFIDADATRVQQALLNLAFNARDAMPNGGRLDIQLDALDDATDGNWARIRISDTGIGMAPEVLSHIFEPFYTTKGTLGTGLGLSQVEGIIAQHGGRIAVESQLGVGTAFTLTLPLSTVGAAPDATQELPVLPTGQRELVLVVEDDPAMRTALVDSLEMLNYQTLEAADGKAALALFTQHADEIALVMSDWMMPLMDGRELLRQLRQLRPTVKYLLLTGYVPGDTEIQAAELNIAWVLKPPTLERLAESIARALRED